MNEDEAQAWLRHGFGQDAVDRCAKLIKLVREEASRQNLISPATLEAIWTRHVVDSAQLVPLAPAAGTWLDIGTGAGFPGMVVAMLRLEHTILVEPRRLRANFLSQVAAELDFSHVEVLATKIENVSATAAVVSARAVAPAEKLLRAAAGCVTTQTRWLLPRGRSGEADLRNLKQQWTGKFHVKQSITDPESSILVLDSITAKRQQR